MLTKCIYDLDLEMAFHAFISSRFDCFRPSNEHLTATLLCSFLPSLA